MNTTSAEPRQLLKNLPVTARLALRDLAAQKSKTAAFTLLIALVLGLLTPLIVAPQLSGPSSYANLLLDDTPYYAASSTPQLQLAGSVVTSHPTLSEFDQQFPGILASADTPVWVPHARVWSSIPDHEASLSELSPNSPVFDRAISVAEGQFPESPGEIAISVDAFSLTNFSGSLSSPPQIGDQLILGTDNQTIVATVVGYFQNSLPRNASLGDFLTVPGTLSPTGTNAATILLFNTAPLTLDAAKRLGTQLDQEVIGAAFAVASATPENALEYAQHLLSQPSYIMNLSQDSKVIVGAIALFVALLFVVVVGIPLFTLTIQRRTPELLHLRRSGASTATVLSTLFMSTLVIAAIATIIGAVTALLVLSLVYDDFPLRLTFTQQVVSTVWLLCGIGAFSSAIIAVAVPTLTTLHKLDGAMPDGQTSSRRTPLRGPWFLTGLGIVLIFVGTQLNTQSVPSLPLICMGVGALTLLIGIYLLLPKIMWFIVTHTHSGALALRIAARELSITQAFTTNAVVPVAFVATVITTFGIIFRQHYLENTGVYAAAYAMVFPILWIPIAGVVIIVGLTFGASLMGLDQILSNRVTLLDMGQAARSTNRIEGYRSMLITSVGAVVGTISGMIFGTAISLFRFSSGGTTEPPQPGALWAWETYLAVLLIPPILSYFVGKQVGHRSNAALQTQSNYQMV